jgi:hypothetical protein
LPKLRKSKVNEVKRLAEQDPDRTDVEIAEKTGLDRKTVGKIRRAQEPAKSLQEKDSLIENLDGRVLDLECKVRSLAVLSKETLEAFTGKCPDCGGKVEPALVCPQCDSSDSGSLYRPGKIREILDELKPLFSYLTA